MKEISKKLEKRLFKALQDPQGMIALTGAGISAPSGIPTFRGEDGLWSKHKVEDLATPGAFSQNPHLVWSWYASRLQSLLKVDPNPAHEALAQLEKQEILGWVITQNVDPLHRRAGSKRLIKLHGDIAVARCTVCSYREQIHESPTINQHLPRCPECGELLRPDVVWFGENLESRIINHAFSVAQKCSICLIVGTSAIVIPAAQIPIFAKQKNNALLLEFNIEPTQLTPLSDLFIQGDASHTLPQFVNWILDQKNKFQLANRND
jgi:NAD-dependent deacetylase